TERAPAVRQQPDHTENIFSRLTGISAAESEPKGGVTRRGCDAGLRRLCRRDFKGNGGGRAGELAARQRNSNDGLDAAATVCARAGRRVPQPGEFEQSAGRERGVAAAEDFGDEQGQLREE